MAKKKIGRPTSFKPEFTQQLLNYFDVKPYKTVKETQVYYGYPVEVNVIQAEDFPTLAGFAILIGVHRDTLHEWANATEVVGKKEVLKHPEFSDAYKRAKDFQENYLVINGLKSLINANFAMFTAKNILGWRDKQPGEEDRVNLNLNTTAKELEEKTPEELKDELKALLEKRKEKTA